MSEFARFLSELIERGKKEKAFTLKELAQRAQITPNYLSNLKQSNRKPPAQKTLFKLTDALCELGVSDAEAQRLIDAYNRQHLNRQEAGSLLESLIDEYKEEIRVAIADIENLREYKNEIEQITRNKKEIQWEKLENLLDLAKEKLRYRFT